MEFLAKWTKNTIRHSLLGYVANYTLYFPIPLQSIGKIFQVDLIIETKITGKNFKLWSTVSIILFLDLRVRGILAVEMLLGMGKGVTTYLHYLREATVTVVSWCMEFGVPCPIFNKDNRYLTGTGAKTFKYIREYPNILISNIGSTTDEVGYKLNT